MLHGACGCLRVGVALHARCLAISLGDPTRSDANRLCGETDGDAAVVVFMAGLSLLRFRGVSVVPHWRSGIEREF